jgi:hypothetical protein
MAPRPSNGSPSQATRSPVAHGSTPAIDVLPRRPAAGDPRYRPGHAEAVLPDAAEDVGLPGDLGRRAVERLQHEVAAPPRPAGASLEQHRLATGAEGVEDGFRRRLHGGSLSRTRLGV